MPWLVRNEPRTPWPKWSHTEAGAVNLNWSSHCTFHSLTDDWWLWGITHNWHSKSSSIFPTAPHQPNTVQTSHVMISRSVLLDDVKFLLGTVGSSQHPSRAEEGSSADGLSGAVQQENHVAHRMILHLLPSNDISFATNTCSHKHL